MSKRILIVEDTRTIPEVIKVYLLGNDYEYLQAPNGEEALKVAGKNRPDLIISDIKMPVMDGFQFCEQLKANPKTKGIPVVLLTSLKDDASRAEGQRVGADGFLNKPIDSEELRKTVKGFLG